MHFHKILYGQTLQIWYIVYQVYKIFLMAKALFSTHPYLQALDNSEKIVTLSEYDF